MSDQERIIVLKKMLHIARRALKQIAGGEWCGHVARANDALQTIEYIETKELRS